jgi:mRNA interferase MazF
VVGLKQGDIIMVDFNPIAGSEQGNYRSALVISNNFTISKTNIITLLPITNTKKNHPLNVALNTAKIAGMVLCSHVRSLDLKTRKFKVVGVVSKEKLEEVLEIVFAMLHS